MVTNEVHHRELETNSFEWKEKAVKMIVVSCFKACWGQAMEVSDTAKGQSAEGPENWTNLFKAHLHSQISAHPFAVRNHSSSLRQYGEEV